MKQMKKILACALALALVLSMPAAASASSPSPITQDTANTGSTDVFYTVEPGYTVTIPASVTVDGDPVTVKAENVKVPKGKQVEVKLSGTSETDNTFKVKTEQGASLTYVVKDESNAEIALDHVFLSVNPDDATTNDGASKTVELTFALAAGEVVKFAGEYKGTVTFTVSVEDVTPAVTP